MNHNPLTIRRLYFALTAGLLTLFLIVPSASFAAKGGKGKGGGEETSTGCLIYANRDDGGSGVDEIQSDSFQPGIYCHGTDGQITVPSVLRHDLKKFNDNGRTIIVDAYCHDSGATCFDSPAEARILQSAGEGDLNGDWTGNALRFPEMGLNEVSRAALDFDLGRQLHVYFGNGSFNNGPTQECGPPANTEAEAAWVRCEAVDAGACVEWTVSSDDLRTATTSPPAAATADDARACLVLYKGGTQLLDTNVEADFEFRLIAN